MASPNTCIPLANVIWLVFLIFFGCVQLCLCFSGNSSKTGSCIERERKALISVQSGIYDAPRWLSWNGKDCCRWKGVRCDTITGHVIKLDLHYPYPYDPWYFRDERHPNKSEMAEVPKLLYIVVLDEGARRGDERESLSFRYTRPVLQSTLQLMGCKARHAFKDIRDW